MTKKTPSRSARILTPLATVAILLVVIEAVVVPLGMLVPEEFEDRHKTLYGLFEPDPELGFHARPNLRDFEMSWFGNSLQAEYDTDEYGFRNVGRSYEDAEIIFVGDSFTWGAWIPREETFAELVGEQTGKRIVNMGQESYYIEQYEKVVHKLYEEILDSDRRRAVAICIFANDLTIPISDDDLANFYTRFGWDAYRDYPTYKKTFTYQASRFIVALGDAIAVQAGWRDPSAPSHLDRETTEDGIELYRQTGAHPYYFSESYYRNAEEVLERLVRYLRDRNAIPLVFLLPSKESSYKDEYTELFPGDYLEIEEKGYQRLCDVARKLEVVCEDLTPAFRRVTQGTDTHFHRDPHWNRVGHRLAAAEIVRVYESSIVR